MNFSFWKRFSSHPRNENFYELLKYRFPRDTTRTLFQREEDVNFSFADLENLSARIARFFDDNDIKPGDRVALQVNKSPEAVCVYVACLRFGAVFLPLELSLQSREIEYILHDARPVLIICTEQSESIFKDLTARIGAATIHTLGTNGEGSLLRECEYLPPLSTIRAVEQNDTACILYTSGTTGNPKGAMITHHNLSSNVAARQVVWQFKPTDALLHVQDITHISGLNAINSAFFSGCTVIFLRDTRVEMIIKHLSETTIFMAGPITYTQLLNSQKLDDTICKKIRLFIFLTAALPQETSRRFREAIGKVILDRYGMTETGIIASNTADNNRVGSCGRLLPGVEVRITDENGTPVAVDEVGNIEVRGPGVFKGYWNAEEKTREAFRRDGFFLTGDLGKLDKDGYLWVVGRLKDIIIYKGANVAAKEVENCINAIDAVEESAVFGVPEENDGEHVIAAVKFKSGQSLTEQQITASLKSQLAEYKIPKRIYFVESLPKTSSGKIQKKVLSQKYSVISAKT